jgi:hypothetical protein
LGPVGSDSEPLDTFHYPTLLFRYRVQINLAHDFRRRTPQGLQGLYRRAWYVGHRYVTMPRNVPRDARMPSFLRGILRCLCGRFLWPRDNPSRGRP